MTVFVQGELDSPTVGGPPSGSSLGGWGASAPVCQ